MNNDLSAETLKIRAAIDAEGLKALQWIAGGGAVALAQFYFTALQHGANLCMPIAIAFTCNLLGLIAALALYRWRRETSLLHNRSDRAPADRASKRDKWVWWIAVGLVGAGLVTVAFGFLMQAASRPICS